MIICRIKQLSYNYLWRMQQNYFSGLKLKNSFTGELEPFVPNQGNNVYWYTCGPTVYSSSHMGHARNYICNDMIRRVLRDHFGYHVNLCLNVTDVDDKIIKDANKQGTDYFSFARKWENDYWEDMGKLGIGLPDSIVRVTEHIPQIVAFIEKIINNGYAYESNGSVYFDLSTYKKKFEYGKLKRIPDAEVEEQQNEKGQKKNKEDFALWKAAKPMEPKWPSPWGEGRPGWHIECSAMASKAMGSQIDIHSGGIDLIFPHHQNEIAQSQAYFQKPNWVKYFIHVGHLHIEGLKMSKSLKNFISIKTLLQRFNARTIRLFFLMRRYDTLIEYDPKESLDEAACKDKRYKDFFVNLRGAVKDTGISECQKYNEMDIEFDNKVESLRSKIHNAFCQNIDTMKVIKEIDKALKIVNNYIAYTEHKITLLQKAYRIFSHAFTVMGLDYQHNLQATTGRQQQIINTFVKFRDQIRKNSKNDFKKILEICDAVRNNQFVDLDIKLEDSSIDTPSTWKYEKKEEMLMTKCPKKKEDVQKMKINPKTMFFKEKKYTQFDENGIPTHQKGDKGEDGINESKPLKPKFREKLKKQWEAQRIIYQQYLQKNGNKDQV